MSTQEASEPESTLGVQLVQIKSAIDTARDSLTRVWPTSSTKRITAWVDEAREAIDNAIKVDKEAI